MAKKRFVTTITLDVEQDAKSQKDAQLRINELLLAYERVEEKMGLHVFDIYTETEEESHG